MKIRFLGTHNIGAGQANPAGVLIDDIVALDAGCLSSLNTTEQLNLRAVLLTHQHYDHLRDLPMLGMNLHLHEASIEVYGLPEVQEVITKHLLNDVLYPNFLAGPAMDYHPITPEKLFQVEDYRVIPIEVKHSVPAVGYEIASGTRRIFYSGDTGPGLSNSWKHLEPDLIIIEVTASNCWVEFGRKSGHLTPALLAEELMTFNSLKGYTPQVYTVHTNPHLQDIIQAELAEVSQALNCSIAMAQEGLEIVF